MYTHEIPWDLGEFSLQIKQIVTEMSRTKVLKKLKVIYLKAEWAE